MKVGDQLYYLRVSIGDTVIDFALVEVIYYAHAAHPRIGVREIYSEGSVIKKDGKRILTVNRLLLYKIKDNEDQYKMVKDIFHTRRAI